MPQVFDEYGIRFIYPDNWSLAEPQGGDGIVDIMVETPGAGFWSVQILPAGMELKECFKKILNGLNQEYQYLEIDRCTDEIAGRQLDGYDVQFFCLDFVVDAKLLGVIDGGRSMIIYYQAEEREFKEMELVFQAISTSLLQS